MVKKCKNRKKNKQKKQQIEKLLTISVVFPSCDQIQPMDGLFYTKDEVAPYCSPENRSFFFLSFSFLFKILFELHGRTSSDCVVRLNYLPLVFYIVQKKKKRKKLSFFFFLSVFVDSRSLHLLFGSLNMKSSGYQQIEPNDFRFCELLWFLSSSFE